MRDGANDATIGREKLPRENELNAVCNRSAQLMVFQVPQLDLGLALTCQCPFVLPDLDIVRLSFMFRLLVRNTYIETATFPSRTQIEKKDTVRVRIREEELAFRRQREFALDFLDRSNDLTGPRIPHGQSRLLARSEVAQQTFIRREDWLLHLWIGIRMNVQLGNRFSARAFHDVQLVRARVAFDQRNERAARRKNGRANHLL